MFDVKRFKAAVALSGLTIPQIAAELGIDTVTLYRKMNGTSDFYRREIQRLCDILQIEDPVSVFFAPNIT